MQSISHSKLTYKNASSKLIIGKPVNNLFKYQWQIFKFKGTKEDFLELWNIFLKEHSCHSCICKKDLEFLEVFRFKKVNNFYSYYPFSVVYRVDDLTDGKFYVGMCEIEEKWNDGYTGSGRKWKNHYNAHPDHEYKRIVLKENFKTPLDTRNFEYSEIEKVFDDKNNCNAQVRTQGQDWFSTKECEECGGERGRHKKGCPFYKEPKLCPECGIRSGHLKTCSKYTFPKPCSECGARCGHLKSCSKYKSSEPCSECGARNGHLKSCSKYKPPKPCPECGGKGGRHRVGCSKYKEHSCSECGSGGIHKPWCSKYKKPKLSEKICQECGGKAGAHKKGCSNYKEREICPECKGVDGHHLKTCSKYISPTPCSECGAVFGHRNNCSKAKRCSECYCINGQHKKSCSCYKQPEPCPECDAIVGHKTSCSKFKKENFKSML